MPDDDRMLDPADLLATIERQQDRTHRQLAVDGTLLYAAWGVALLVGNLLFYFGVDPRTLAPGAVVGIGYAILLCLAGVVTWWHIATRQAGISGPASRQGMMWGISWVAGFAGMQLIGIALIQQGMSSRLSAHFFALVSMLVVGLMYLTGAALWRDRLQFACGLLVIVAAGAAGLVGLPAGYLVLAVVAGGGLLVCAAVARVVRHR